MGQHTLFLLVVFSLLALQNALGYALQVRQYRRLIKKSLGRGIVGVGRKRGIFAPGELVVLLYNPWEDKTLSVQSMRGRTVFARFRELEGCMGLSLEDLRRRAFEEDRWDLRLWRTVLSCKPGRGRKGALIQAVERVDACLEQRAKSASPQVLHNAAGNEAPEQSGGAA